jgi:hypothetical protein
MSDLFTSTELAAYQRDGYVLVRSLFDRDEIGRLAEYARRDSGLSSAAYGRKDAAGMPVRLALWNTPSDDLYGMFSRSRRIVDRVEQLLHEVGVPGEAYHWHAKMILKEPRVGGAWEWHQDYGYWYHNGCLAPELVSCWIAIDPSTRENGCLQVLRGSHHLGRIDHGKTGDQTGADLERVEQALQRHELVYIEAQPGDALFFHCNLLHRSDQNRSENPRWSLICCYNAARNSPYKESRHPAYSPLAKVGDDAIKTWSDA